MNYEGLINDIYIYIVIYYSIKILSFLLKCKLLSKKISNDRKLNLKNNIVK